MLSIDFTSSRNLFVCYENLDEQKLVVKDETFLVEQKLESGQVVAGPEKSKVCFLNNWMMELCRY